MTEKVGRLSSLGLPPHCHPLFVEDSPRQCHPMFAVDSPRQCHPEASEGPCIFSCAFREFTTVQTTFYKLS
jgi:hypothetical protein